MYVRMNNTNKNIGILIVQCPDDGRTRPKHVGMSMLNKLEFVRLLV